MRLAIAALTLLAFAALAHGQSAPTHRHDMDHAAHGASAERQAEVAERGKDVMPFSLDKTVHLFTKNVQGGVQQVVARQRDDREQQTLVRQHLKQLRQQFLQGDFSGPSHIHGPQMQGLATLAAAQPGQLRITYKDIPGGAQLVYRTDNAELVAAVHRWFDAQLADHGKDAAPGHHH